MKKIIKIKHNEENCEHLASLLLDSWDIDDIISYAIEKLKEHYLADKEAFDYDSVAMTEQDESDIDLSQLN